MGEFNRQRHLPGSIYCMVCGCTYGFVGILGVKLDNRFYTLFGVYTRYENIPRVCILRRRRLRHTLLV
jgi:hypothetical protein